MFTFAWPYAFLLLPLFWVIQAYFPARHADKTVMLRVPFLSTISALENPSSINIMPKHLRQFYAICAWSLLIIACANPEWLGEPLPMSQNGRNIMLAVDLSPSMAIPDLARNNQLINRLESVKTVAAPFIDHRQGDKLGLILFGSKAYLQTPLTFDRVTVSSMLNDATVGLAGDHTAIGDALGLAIKKFSTENIHSRILILLTDGGNNAGDIDPLEAADLAKQQHIKIYTIGIGASELQMNNGLFSQTVNPSADLDEALLKNIASKTEGRYFRAEDQTALADILHSINQLEPVSAESKTARPISALFFWPLAAALIFFMVALR